MHLSIQQFLLPILLVALEITADGDEPKDFTFHSKEEFCTAKYNLLVNPKYIPVLLDYLRYCCTLSKMPNGKAFERRHALMHLLETATPVLHKAFFDSKTGLKQIVTFTKMKHEAVQYTKYADGYEDGIVSQRKTVNGYKGMMTYNPETDNGSYNLAEDLRLCSAILNREPGTSVKNLIKASQLPRVAKAARLITFPPFNLTVRVSGDDTPYMILDMYVLAMRCLSFTNLNVDISSQVSENLINWLKKKVMPFIPPHEFEKAYSGMMSLIEHRTVDKSRFQASTLKTRALLKVEDFSESQSTDEIPILLRLQYDFKVASDTHTDDSSEAIVSVTANKLSTSNSRCLSTARHSCPTKSSLSETSTVEYSPSFDEVKSVLDVVPDKINDEEEEAEIAEDDILNDATPSNSKVECHTCKSRLSSKAVVMIGVLVGACGTLALILYCLLFGCCGWVSVSRSSTKCEDEDVDDVDSYLEDYTRQRMSVESNLNRCYCTMADTNQVDVIVALHKRCETLSKKICDVIHEISNERVFEQTASMEMLREFIRNISEEMVDDEETFRQLRKLHEQSFKPQSCLVYK
ncbi:hypothetical protein GE061_016482 [Apolygus lucorum]|uniref:Uncharacterized protein n=1 Tax=Apolygus lucorum TaxID=248454 RepID=A0A6A4JZ82_APOLU|nr:hypothetical protein GE061_016482 [Apolygus lucorum]